MEGVYHGHAASPPSSPVPSPAPARKGVKRPALSPFADEDVEVPDLAHFQAVMALTDVEMIRLCTTYAAYLKAVHRKTR